MSIVIDARYLDGTYSGIGTYSRDLLQNLARVDQETPYTVLLGRGFRDRLALGANFTIRRFDAAPISPATLTGLGGAIAALRPTAFHALFPLVPLGLDVSTIVTVHDMQPFTDPDFHGRRNRLARAAYARFYAWAYPAAFTRAKWILCVSHATRDDVAMLMPSVTPKLVVVHSGIEKPTAPPPSPDAVLTARARHGIGGDYLLYFGSTRPNKNLPGMVKAFGKLVRREDARFPDLKFVLIVKKDRFFRSVEKQIAARSLQDRVVVLPQVEEADKRALLAGCRALAFATRYEGFGFPALEAMQLGVPVIAGASGALPEICGGAAVLVDPFDGDAIAEGMFRALVDAGLRERLAREGPARAAAFDWTHTAETVRDIYAYLG